MTGSGLIDFLVNIIVLLAAGAIFFLSIDKIAPDEFFAKIAKIAVGALLLVALIVVVAAVFGMGGGLKVSAQGVLWFAIAVIVAVVVLYILNMVVDWIATNMGFPQLAAAIKYVLGAIVLIALLVAAANFLFGYKIGNFRVGEIEGYRPGTSDGSASAGYLSQLRGSTQIPPLYDREGVALDPFPVFPRRVLFDHIGDPTLQ